MLCLQNAKGVFIRHAIDMMEILSGYDTGNRYEVYVKNPGDENNIMLFYCKEMSSCCDKVCFKPPERPFYLNIKHVTNFNFDRDFSTNNFAVFIRPLALKICFCNQSEMLCHYRSKDGSRFGKVSLPCVCCDPVWQVVNSQGQVAYSITTNCCTCGYMCSNKCVCYDQVIFNIFKGGEFNAKDSSSICGKIVKNAMGKDFTDTISEHLEIIFPHEAAPEEKLNIIGASLLIEYGHFMRSKYQ